MELSLLRHILNLHRISLQSSATGTLLLKPFKMATKRRLLVQRGFGKKIAQNVWNNIAPDYLQFLLQIHAAKNAGRH